MHKISFQHVIGISKDTVRQEVLLKTHRKKNAKIQNTKYSVVVVFQFDMI